MLLHNVKKHSPFFLCLLGEQYGTHLEETAKSRTSMGTHSSKSKNLNWIEKNLHIASQTGYSHLVNQFSFNNSFLEYQINAALQNEANHNYYRFYYRQSEYLERKFEHLSIEERKEAFQNYEAENEYCESKIKELKLRIAKKGIVVKYYSTLEQLHELVYEDLVDLIQDYMKSNLKLSKSKTDWMIEMLQEHKLANFLITNPIQELLISLESFCRKEPPLAASLPVVISKEDTSNSSEKENYSEGHFNRIEQLQTQEYREILKLRHANMSR